MPFFAPLSCMRRETYPVKPLATMEISESKFDKLIICQSMVLPVRTVLYSDFHGWSLIGTQVSIQTSAFQKAIQYLPLAIIASPYLSLASPSRCLFWLLLHFPFL